MGRYLLGDQVWVIDREATRIRIVEDGVEKIETFADAATTALRFTILTNQKMRAGWKLEREPTRAKPPLLPKQPDVFDARNPALEAAIIADPDSEEAWVIYGDWLQQQGDPRGEMIARYAAAKHDHTQFHRVGLREDAYHDYFYGGLSKGLSGLTLQWGFIHTVFIRRQTDAHVALKQVLTNSAARMLGDIGVASEDPDDLRRSLQLLIKYAPPTVRGVGLDGPLADITPLVALMPRLRELRLLAETSIAPLVSVHAPELRVLAVRPVAQDAASLLQWIDMHAPRLVDLRIFSPLDLAMFEHARFTQQIETLRLDGDPDRIVALFPKLRRVFVKFGTDQVPFRSRGIEVEEDEEEDEYYDDVVE